MTEQLLAEPNTILRAVVGSTLHGLAVDDGLEDRDEMGVCIEPPECVIGLRRFEQWTFRTKPEGVRSEAGDLDLVVYSLRKWMRLALSGNPTVLLLLFAPPCHIVSMNEWGERLRMLAPLLASRRHGTAFKGYLQSQRRRVVENKGQRPVRPELIERHGFDTKYAMHMLRLGNQGVEYLETGRITLPAPEPLRTHLRNVRLGRVALSDVLDEVVGLERRLDDLLAGASPLPDRPDDDGATRFLVEAYTGWWSQCDPKVAV